MAVYAKTVTKLPEAVLSLVEAVVVETTYKMRVVSPDYARITMESTSCLTSNKGKDSNKMLLSKTTIRLKI